MKNYLKQFMGWATGLKHNIFNRARIRLTLFYVVIMMLVMSIFSFTLFFTFERNIKGSFHDDIDILEIRDRAFHRAVDNLESLIITIDGFLLIIVAGASYLLSDRTLKPIKEALESQKRFTADASHDLRTPLAIITTQTEVALSSKDTNISEYKSILKSNLEEVHKMSVLVDSLLSIARTENNSSKNNFTLVNIQNFIKNLVSKTAYQTKEKNINLKVVNDISGFVMMDEYSFERAIQNILQNALHYTPKGGTISVKTSENNSSYMIEISDTGVGISDSDITHVFDRFYKASHSRNDMSGSGLGLPIAKKIIEDHNGDISIKSQVEKGTTVAISIPKNKSK